jgi:hypothetical protein
MTTPISRNSLGPAGIVWQGEHLTTPVALDTGLR